MKYFVYFAIFCVIQHAVDAGPTQCFSCNEVDAATCSTNQQNQACAADPLSLGTTHCASVSIEYYGNETDIANRELTDGFIRGCIDCADKKAACFALMGALKAQKKWSMRRCEIECCTGDNCNTQTPSLGDGGGVRVFTPEADWPKKCHACDGKDADSCAANQRSQTCVTDPNSLGTTYCASVLGKYRDKAGKVQETFYRGCVECTKQKQACYSLGGFLKRKKEWSLQQCAIDCCQGIYCNTRAPKMSSAAIPVFPLTAVCNSCFGSDVASCGANQKTQYCTSSKQSLGTGHCASLVGKFRDQSGNVVDGFYRGCVNCADKKGACSTIGGYIRASKGWSLEKCEIECCTGSSCNTQVPTLSDDTAIPVFLPPAAGESLQCLYCLESQGICDIGPKQSLVCTKGQDTLGTRRCYSAAFQFRDQSNPMYDHIKSGYIQGCIDSCEDTKAACAAIGGLLKARREWTLTKCHIECCTGDKCNLQTVTLPWAFPGNGGQGSGSTPTGYTPGYTTKKTESRGGQLASFTMSFALAFGNVLYLF